MDTGRGASHTRVCWGLGDQGRDIRGLEDWGGITSGEIPNVGDRGMEAANHYGMCNNPARSAYVSPNLK